MNAPPVNATAYVVALLSATPVYDAFVNPVFKHSTVVELYSMTAIWLVGLAAYIAALVCTLYKTKAAGEKLYIYRWLERPEGRYLSFNVLLCTLSIVHL